MEHQLLRCSTARLTKQTHKFCRISLGEEDSWKRVLGERPFGSKTVFTETWSSIIKVCSAAQDLPNGIVPSTRGLGAVKVLRIKADEGSPAVAPTEETVKSGSYPIVLSFNLVWNARSKDPVVQDFVHFCQSQSNGK